MQRVEPKEGFEHWLAENRGFVLDAFRAYADSPDIKPDSQVSDFLSWLDSNPTLSTRFDKLDYRYLYGACPLSRLPAELAKCSFMKLADVIMNYEQRIADEGVEDFFKIWREKRGVSCLGRSRWDSELMRLTVYPEDIIWHALKNPVDAARGQVGNRTARILLDEYKIDVAAIKEQKLENKETYTQSDFFNAAAQLVLQEKAVIEPFIESQREAGAIQKSWFRCFGNHAEYWRGINIKNLRLEQIIRLLRQDKTFRKQGYQILDIEVVLSTNSDSIRNLALKYALNRLAKEEDLVQQFRQAHKSIREEESKDKCYVRTAINPTCASDLGGLLDHARKGFFIRNFFSFFSGNRSYKTFFKIPTTCDVDIRTLSGVSSEELSRSFVNRAMREKIADRKPVKRRR